MSVPVVQHIGSSRIDLRLKSAGNFRRPSFLPSDNIRLFTFESDTKLGEYLCRAWLQGHRRYVHHEAFIPMALEPKSTSANLRYVERVVKVLDQNNEEDGGLPLEKQAAMLRKLAGRVLESHALRTVTLKSQRLRTRLFDILALYQAQFDASESAEETVALQARLCACLALLYSMTEESGLLVDRQSLLHPAPYTLSEIIGLVGQEFAMEHDAYLNTDQDDWEGENAEGRRQMGAEARLLQEIQRDKVAAGDGTAERRRAEAKEADMAATVMMETRRAESLEASTQRRRRDRGLHRSRERESAAAGAVQDGWESPASADSTATPGPVEGDAGPSHRGMPSEMDQAHYVHDVLRRLQTAVLVQLVHTCLDSNKVDLTLEWRIPRHLFLTPDEVVEDLWNMICLQHPDHSTGIATSASEDYMPPDVLDYSGHPALNVSVACSFGAQLFCLMNRWANQEFKTIDAHMPVIQFFANEEHKKILEKGNELDKITSKMMIDEIKRRKLKLGHTADEMARKVAEKAGEAKRHMSRGIVIDKGATEAGKSVI